MIAWRNTRTRSFAQGTQSGVPGVISMECAGRFSSKEGGRVSSRAHIHGQVLFFSLSHFFFSPRRSSLHLSLLTSFLLGKSPWLPLYHRLKITLSVLGESPSLLLVRVFFLVNPFFEKSFSYTPLNFPFLFFCCASGEMRRIVMSHVLLVDGGFCLGFLLFCLVVEGWINFAETGCNIWSEYQYAIRFKGLTKYTREFTATKIFSKD